MRGTRTGKVRMAPFEFQRNGPAARKPGGHKPDFTLSIMRPSQANAKNRAMNLPTPRRQKRNPLDELFIVDVTGTSDFDEIVELDGSGKHLNEVQTATLRGLPACKKIDLSDNRLPLEPFAVMPNLEELDLSCNQIQTFSFSESEELAGDVRAWNALHTLNLGFNSCMKCVTDLTCIPFLSVLNLCHNGISVLPANLMHFTCLTTLNLAGNHLNSEAAFLSLATIPSLQHLILDENGIAHVPKFQFGFETLATLSLKGNKIETAEDIESLTDLEQLQTVDICKNPLVLRTKSLGIARKIFSEANIALVTHPGEAPKKKVLAGPIRTVTFDPLTLPSFTKEHIKALNKKHSVKYDMSKEGIDRALNPTTAEKTDVDLFITGFGSAADQNEVKKAALDIEPTPLPEEEPEPPITNIWAEVPVTGLEKRLRLTEKTRTKFEMAFNKLQYLVSHPDMRIKPRESPSTGLVTPKQTAPDSARRPVQPPKKKPRVSRKKPAIAAKLQARTEYTKGEIHQMLQSMEERLAVVEHELSAADESGQTAVDMALDQRNFASLHKQYETIRAELINTLNG